MFFGTPFLSWPRPIGRMKKNSDRIWRYVGMRAEERLSSRRWWGSNVRGTALEQCFSWVGNVFDQNGGEVGMT